MYFVYYQNALQYWVDYKDIFCWWSERVCSLQEYFCQFSERIWLITKYILLIYQSVFVWLWEYIFLNWIEIIFTCSSCCWPEWSWSSSCMIWGIEAWQKILSLSPCQRSKYVITRIAQKQQYLKIGCMIWGIEAWQKYVRLMIITIWESNICNDKNCSKIAISQILNLSSKHIGTLNVYVAYEPTHAFYHYLQIRVEGHVACSAVPPTVAAVVAVPTLTTWKPANWFMNRSLEIFCLLKSVTYLKTQKKW